MTVDELGHLAKSYENRAEERAEFGDMGQAALAQHTAEGLRQAESLLRALSAIASAVAETREHHECGEVVITHDATGYHVELSTGLRCYSDQHPVYDGETLEAALGKLAEGRGKG